MFPKRKIAVTASIDKIPKGNARIQRRAFFISYGSVEMQKTERLLGSTITGKLVVHEGEQTVAARWGRILEVGFSYFDLKPFTLFFPTVYG